MNFYNKWLPRNQTYIKSYYKTSPMSILLWTQYSW